MPRPEKVEAVEDIKERLESTPAVFFAEYRGLSVSQQQSLRRSLREVQTEFRVLKMSLARRAASELGLAELEKVLGGPTALAFAASDPAVAARALRDFGRDHAQLLVKGAWLQGQLLAPEKVTELADLEPREVLLAMAAGALKAPMAGLAGLMAALTGGTATVLSRLLEKRTPSAPSSPTGGGSGRGQETKED
ncbi:MAG: 50S ribosomal protein L10 [Acidimicrobiia bacterium]